MNKRAVLIGVFLTLCLSLVHFVVVEADDWNGILCYAGMKANTKTCSSCVTLYNDYSIIKRDCYESLSPQEQRQCESGSDVKCIHCFEPFCNRGHPKHKCVICDSKLDRKCLNDVLTLNQTQCIYDSLALDDFYCYVKWDKDTGDNERGCVTSSTEYSFCGHNNETCHLCNAGESNACNTIAFPPERRKCIHCDSTNDKCPTQDEPTLVSKYSAYCYNITDSCVVIQRATDHFMQTCASQMPDAEKSFCNDNQKQCSFCDENNCNFGTDEATATEPTTEAATTVGPTTDNPTTEPIVNTTLEISTKKPSNGSNQFSGCHILLCIFVIVSLINGMKICI